MYEEYSMDGVEDLLDFFNLEETEKIIRDHILNPEDYGIGQSIDYYRPYYVKYQQIHVDIDKGITENDVKICRERAKIIALMFISAISQKFNLDVDDEWLDNMSESELQGVTLILYSFFILNLREILIEVMTKYIDINHEELAKSFDDNPKTNKDATYISLKKVLPSDFVVISSNIYDVCYLILDRMNEEQFIEYIDADNEIQETILSFFQDGHITGNFIDSIDNMIRSNASGLKSSLSFEILAYIINTYSTDKTIEKI